MSSTTLRVAKSIVRPRRQSSSKSHVARCSATASSTKSKSRSGVPSERMTRVCWLDSGQDCVRHRSRSIKIPTAVHVRDACHCQRLAERVPVGNAGRSGRGFGDVVRMPRLERVALAVRRVVMGAVDPVGSGDEVALDAGGSGRHRRVAHVAVSEVDQPLGALQDECRVAAASRPRTVTWEPRTRRALTSQSGAD